MKILDPAATMDGTGPTIEVLPFTHIPQAPARPRWWRHPWRWWTTRNLSKAMTSRFRLRVKNAAGQTVLDVGDYELWLMLAYSEVK